MKRNVILLAIVIVLLAAGLIYRFSPRPQSANKPPEAIAANSPGQDAPHINGIDAKWLAGILANNSAVSSDGDWPGEDPPAVPRPDGLRRRLSMRNPAGAAGEIESRMAVYQSSAAAASLKEWYLQALPQAGWNFDATASSEANAMMEGALCFTRGRHACLVWIAAGSGQAPTSVMVRTHPNSNGIEH